jgi:hypothetical protein
MFPMKCYCKLFDIFITSDKKQDPGSVVLYILKTRLFSVSFVGGGSSAVKIEFCPFCGCKFPDELSAKMQEIILEELGDDYLPDNEGNEPKKKLPEEFLTDEWWKKHGL